MIGVVLWRAYPISRMSKGFGMENVLGATIGAVWGALLLIVLLTMLRYFSVVPWREQEGSQRNVVGQIHSSHVAPVLQVVASPLWQVMVPWFPDRVSPRL